MILGAVFFVSFSTLAFEVLLTRVFSIGQWNHLSFMVISIALFGFAASGTFLSILDARSIVWQKSLSSRASIANIIVLYTSTVILSFIALNKLPLDYFRLPLEPIQSLYLFVAYLVLALPFFFSGLIVSMAYAIGPQKTGLIYFASMSGSACGAILPVPLLPLLGEGKVIILSALIPLILIPFASFKRLEGNQLNHKDQRLKQIGVGLYGFGVILFAGFLMTSSGVSIIQIKPSPYKALSQILQFPNTHIAKTLTSIRGRTDSIVTPYIRFAPGLSLRYTETLPPQDAVFRDGDNQFVLYDIQSEQDVYFARFTLPYSGYYLRLNPQKVLILLQGGGSAIPCALASGARNITIVEQNPHIAQILRNHYGLPVVNQNSRAFLARSQQRFDIIHVENWGTTIPGSAALNQDHFFTTDAFIEYLNHLAADGLIIISRKLLLPPADSLRLWSAAYEGAKKFGIENPETHLAILRNWDTFTLIVSIQPLREASALEEFALTRNFDLVFLPDIKQEMVNRFNKFNEPYHFLEISRLAADYRNGNEKRYFKAYLLDIVPQSDGRPFPGRFLKWPKLKTLYKSMGSRLYALLMSGEIVVSVVFTEALLVTLMLLLMPIFFVLKRGKKPSFSQIFYFFGVGAGFMFIELFFIKKFIILFGDPVISFTIVVAGILVFSSLGGLWAQIKKKYFAKTALIGLIGILLLTFISLDTFVDRILGLSAVWQYLCALLLLFPTGFLMGLPFPLGMRYLLEFPAQRAYAWSVNGCASVLTSILSAQIALSFGISFILVCAIGAYCLAFFSVANPAKS